MQPQQAVYLDLLCGMLLLLLLQASLPVVQLALPLCGALIPFLNLQSHVIALGHPAHSPSFSKGQQSALESEPPATMLVISIAARTWFPLFYQML